MLRIATLLAALLAPCSALAEDWDLVSEAEAWDKELVAWLDQVDFSDQAPPALRPFCPACDVIAQINAAPNRPATDDPVTNLHQALEDAATKELARGVSNGDGWLTTQLKATAAGIGLIFTPSSKEEALATVAMGPFGKTGAKLGQRLIRKRSLSKSLNNASGASLNKRFNAPGGIEQRAIETTVYLRQTHQRTKSYAPRQNFKGGGKFKNDENHPALPKDGQFLKFDILENKPGVNRGEPRILIDETSGRAWYTPDHYKTFFEMDRSLPPQLKTKLRVP